jgi:hypothetical protein
LKNGMGGAPGSHLRNWRPGDEDADELHEQKIRDAVRDGASDRQLAKLLNLPRKTIWRMRLYAEIPDGLFDRLVVDAEPMISTRGLTFVGLLP